VINVVACGLVQPSPVRTASLDIVTATPTIACPGVPASTALGTIGYQNNVNCTFTDASAAVQAATTICYHTDGTQPSCQLGVCDGASTAVATGASVAVTASNTAIVAVACAPNLASSAAATATLDLAVTPVVVAGTGTCPETVTIGLDQTMASSPPSGPTHGATICFSTDGTVPAPNCYANGTAPPSVTCFNSGNGGAETSTVMLSATTTLRSATCLTGFQGATAPKPFTFTPFTFSPGSVGQFSVDLAATQLLANHNGDAAYLAYDATTLYIGVGATSPGSSASWSPSASTFVVVYVGDGTEGATMTGAPQFGSPPLPVPASFVLSWETDDVMPASASVWSGSGWMPASFVPSVSYTSGSKVMLTVPLSAVNVLSELTLVGAVVKNVGAGTPTAYETFPALGVNNPSYSHFVSAILSSCLGPAQQVQ
jgi:hypothetical protein